MKKIIATLFLLCALIPDTFAQTQDRLPDLKEYQSNMNVGSTGFGPRRRELMRNNQDLTDKILALDRDENKEGYQDLTPLQWALRGFYIYDAETCPPAAEAILPHNNPRLVDRQLGAYVYKGLLENRFLGNTTAVSKYEAVLQFITGRGNATRAEIEKFYRDNVRALIAAVVDEEFKGKSVNNDTKRIFSEVITTPLVDFYLTPSQTNFDKLKRNVTALEEIVDLPIDAKSVNGIADLKRYGYQGETLYELLLEGLIDTSGCIKLANVQDRLNNRNIAQILRRAASEGRSQQSRMASQRFSINNVGNVEWENILWYEPISLINKELAERLRQ